MAAILLIVSIACSLIPCCQFDDCASEQLLTETPANEHEDEGVCSPFFSCTSCPGFTQLTKNVQLPQPATQKQSHYINAAVFLFADYDASFWQPPREFC